MGAGIQIPSNSSRILHDLGLGPFLEPYVCEPEGISFRRWQDGTKIAYTKLVPDFRKKFGAPFYVVHRADFHRALYERSLEVGVTVQVGHKVASYDELTPSVTLESGEVFSADLVVAADGKHRHYTWKSFQLMSAGIKSLARPQINHLKNDGPVATGFAAYRATIDVTKMKEDPDTAWLLESESQNLW